MFFGYLPEPNIGIFLPGVVCAVIDAGLYNLGANAGREKHQRAS
jgi:hypothetical protein